MTTTATARRSDPRRRRALQRAAHLVTGLALLAELYAAPLLGTGFTSVVQWVLVPVVITSGVAMWQGPRIRRVVRGWSALRV